MVGKISQGMGPLLLLWCLERLPREAITWQSRQLARMAVAMLDFMCLFIERVPVRANASSFPEILIHILGVFFLAHEFSF